MSDLKACPFCGTAGHLMRVGETDSSLWDVVCMNKECIMRSGSQISFFNALDAIDAWNTRKTESHRSTQDADDPRKAILNRLYGEIECLPIIDGVFVSLREVKEILDEMEAKL